MSIPPASSNFFPSSDALGFVPYPPVSPDFPSLPPIHDTPGSAPEPPTMVPNWIKPPAPGGSPDLDESGATISATVPVPRATPLPYDHVKFETSREIFKNISTEDELPKFSPKDKVSCPAFNGYD